MDEKQKRWSSTSRENFSSQAIETCHARHVGQNQDMCQHLSLYLIFRVYNYPPPPLSSSSHPPPQLRSITLLILQQKFFLRLILNLHEMFVLDWIHGCRDSPLGGFPLWSIVLGFLSNLLLVGTVLPPPARKGQCSTVSGSVLSSYSIVLSIVLSISIKSIVLYSSVLSNVISIFLKHIVLYRSVVNIVL